MFMQRQHFSRVYDSELQEIREKLLEMGGKVELMIANAVRALLERETELAESTIAYDREINRLELEIDEKCLEVIARRQPAARDLRFITMALKVVTDLERIGDKCANIAKRVKELNAEPPLKPYIDLPRMAEAASGMLHDALDAFMRGDEELARKVCQGDRFVDDLNQQIQRELLTYMMADSAAISRALKINHISKCLERIADHATNLAEMVIFLVKGRDVRHASPAAGCPSAA